MKCEIVTIYSTNYGNRLQNYALQEVLKNKFGVKVTTNRAIKLSLKNYFAIIVRRLRRKTKSDLFVSFDSNISWRYTDRNNIDCDEIDYYIAGSDQIWNPFFSFNTDREFLAFTDGRKKIAYAASIGVTNLPENELTRFKNNLSDFKAISMREDAGADIVEDILGKRPPVVLDPTMLLSKKEWDEVAQKTKVKIEHPYIVKYYLGIRDEKTEYAIDEYAKNNGYDVVDLLNTNDYAIGPAEFIYLLGNSQMNFVDSFHGTVFSLIFHKNFYTFNRPNEEGYGDMNSRFSSLFNKFGFVDRFVVECPEISEISKERYIEFEKELTNEIKQSLDFIHCALN